MDDTLDRTLEELEATVRDTVQRLVLLEDLHRRAAQLIRANVIRLIMPTVRGRSLLNVDLADIANSLLIVADELSAVEGGES